MAKAIVCPKCKNKIVAQKDGEVVVCSNCGKKLRVKFKKAGQAAKAKPVKSPIFQGMKSGKAVPPTTKLERPKPSSKPASKPVAEPATKRISKPSPKPKSMPRPTPIPAPAPEPKSEDIPRAKVFERFGDIYEDEDVGQVESMHDIDLGRDDDSQIDADTGGLTDFTSTFVVDWSQAPKEVIDGLQALEVNRRASDMVQVDNSVIPDVERIEQHAGDDEDVERIELESADEVINRDSKIGFKILTEAEKIKESVDWKTEHEEVQNVMKNLRAHRRRYLAIFILGPLVLLFLIVLVTGPLVFKHYMYFGEWTGTFGDPRGASLAVDVDLERSGNKLSGELVFLPIAGEVPDKSQVPMSMLSFYTGDPIPVYGGFTANSVTLNLVTDPKHTDKVMTFNLVATNDRGELSGFVELANKSMLQIKLTRL